MKKLLIILLFIVPSVCFSQEYNVSQTNFNYKYSGKQINLGKNKFSRNSYKQFQVSHIQSMAIYGNYIIFVTNVHDKLNGLLFDINTTEKIADLTFDYGMLKNPHGNTLCFGNEFADTTDDMPLLYLSQWNFDGERGVLVYRIKKTDDLYSAEFKQSILPDFSNMDFSKFGNGSTDWIVDTDNNMLYSIAYKLKGSSRIVKDNATMICKFYLPKLSDGEKVLLDSSNILDNYQLSIINVVQDKCYYDGHIYILSGPTPASEWKKIRVLNLSTKKIESEVPLVKWQDEPESIEIFNNSIIQGYNTGEIYQLYFK